MDDRLVPRLTAEAVGTFALVLIGPGSAVVNAWSNGAVTQVGIALSFLLVVMTMVYSLGPISGAHLNPAVTLGFWSVGRFPAREVVPYSLAQLAGGVAAAATLGGVLPAHLTSALTLPVIGTGRTVVIEALLTFLLMLVIMGVAGPERSTRNFAGLAIGSAVGFDALFGGPLTGASMNPARSFGPAIAAGRWDSHWAYWLGPIAGAVLAARLHDYLAKEADHA